MKRGRKPIDRISIKWSPNLAYIIGLIASDGCLYNDKRHICFVSTDYELVNFIREVLMLTNKISEKKSEHKKQYRIQFGSVLFYEFLNSVGIFMNKSKTIQEVMIPDEYFFDYLRGYFDGDGSFYSYCDKRAKGVGLMYYISFSSGSGKYLEWLQNKILCLAGVVGHGWEKQYGGVFQLKYAKREALEIISKMYYNPGALSLSRKRLKIYSCIGER